MPNRKNSIIEEYSICRIEEPLNEHHHHVPAYHLQEARSLEVAGGELPERRQEKFSNRYRESSRSYSCTPEDFWDWMKETGVDPDDGTHTALELAEKLDHKHKQAIKKAEQKKEAEKKEQKNEKLDNNGENKRANADVDNPVDIRSNKRRCLRSESDDDSQAIKESSSSAEESSSSNEQSSSSDERSSDDERLSDDDGSRKDDSSKVESDGDSCSSDRRNSSAKKQGQALPPAPPQPYVQSHYKGYYGHPTGHHPHFGGPSPSGRRF